MEHYEYFKNLKESSGFIPDENAINSLYDFAEYIFNENSRFNLTGYKSIREIIDNLITGSLIPFLKADVPRGTFFCDLGSGSGIPGIPLAVVFSSISGILVDSNSKKTAFHNDLMTRLGINNIKTLCIRVEDMGRDDEYRGKFDLVVSRAFAPEYVVFEMGAPLLKTGGSMFIYSKKIFSDLPDSVKIHASDLGLTPGNDLNIDISSGGIALVKKSETDMKYPRRYPVIKRDSDRAANDC